MVREAAVWICTKRLELLSRVGHDLKLHVGGVALEGTGPALSADTDPTQIRVVGAMRGGQVDVRLLSERDRDAILRSLQQAVLDIRRFPRIHFSGHHGEEGLHGMLALCGQQRPLVMPYPGQSTGSRRAHWIIATSGYSRFLR